MSIVSIGLYGTTRVESPVFCSKEQPQSSAIGDWVISQHAGNAYSLSWHEVWIAPQLMLRISPAFDTEACSSIATAIGYAVREFGESQMFNTEDRCSVTNYIWSPNAPPEYTTSDYLTGGSIGIAGLLTWLLTSGWISVNEEVVGIGGCYVADASPLPLSVTDTRKKLQGLKERTRVHIYCQSRQADAMHRAIRKYAPYPNIKCYLSHTMDELIDILRILSCEGN